MKTERIASLYAAANPVPSLEEAPVPPRAAGYLDSLDRRSEMMGTKTPLKAVPHQRRRIGWATAAVAVAVTLIGVATWMTLGRGHTDVAPADEGFEAQIAAIQAMAEALNSEDFDAWLATMAPSAEVPFYILDETRSLTSAIADDSWTRTEFDFNAALDRRLSATDCRPESELIVSCLLTDRFVLEALQFSDRIAFFFDESGRIDSYSRFIADGAMPDEAADLLGPSELEGWRSWVLEQHPQAGKTLFLPDAGSDIGNGVFVRERRNDGLVPDPENASQIRDLVAEWFALSPAERAPYTERFASP